MLRIELHESESSLEEISKDYAGYVAADLAALVRSFMTPMTTVVISNKEDTTYQSTNIIIESVGRSSYLLVRISY